MSDLRQGVSEAVQRVLDMLDRSRDGWLRLGDDGVTREIVIEGAALEILTEAAAGGDIDQRAAARGVAMRSPGAARLLALLLFQMERAADAAPVLAGDAL